MIQWAKALAMGLIQKGYVALLKSPLTQEVLEAIVENWLTRFDAVEQLRPDGGEGVFAFAVRDISDMVWERDLQFRVLAGEQFAWVYLTADRRILESDGLSDPGGAVLSFDVFSELPGCERIVSDSNDKT